MTDMPTLDERIAAKEAELAAAKAALGSGYGHTVGGSSRRKQFAIRVDADIRRTAERFAAVKRLEHEIATLRRRAEDAQRPAPDLSRLPYAAAIRTRWGWYRVIKVNRVTVKVVAEPGMDDLIKISQIIAIHERPARPTTEAAALNDPALRDDAVNRQTPAPKENACASSRRKNCSTRRRSGSATTR